MTPPASNVVDMDVARLAVNVQELKGDFALLQSSVSQRIDVLTTMMNNIQHGQMLAGEERMKQLTLLTQLSERTAVLPDANTRMQALERQVSLWRGLVLGLGFTVSLVVYVYQSDKAAMLATVGGNTAAIRALERAK